MKNLIIPTAAAFALSFGSLAAQTPTQPHTTPTTPQTGQQQQRTDEQRDQRGQTMTFTGCLQRGTEAGTYLLTNVEHAPGAMGTGTQTGAHTGTGTATGQTGTATGTQDPQRTGEHARTGQTDPHAGMQHGTKQAYRLEAADNVNLSQHVGHQVRVTASVQQQPGQAGQTGQQDQYRTGDQARTGQDQYRTPGGTQAQQPDQPRTGQDQQRAGQPVGTTGAMATAEAQRQAERAPKLKVQNVTMVSQNCQ
jgi:hypothetical protein